jgi:hypothetical protein
MEIPIRNSVASVSKSFTNARQTDSLKDLWWDNSGVDVSRGVMMNHLFHSFILCLTTAFALPPATAADTEPRGGRRGDDVDPLPDYENVLTD